MYTIFSFKQFLRTTITHLWPVSLLIIAGIILLTPRHDFGVIHTSLFAEAIFGFTNDPANAPWREALTVSVTILAWALILLVILRIITGLIASNKRIFRDAARKLTDRPAVFQVTVSGLDKLTFLNRTYRLQKQDATTELIMSYMMNLAYKQLLRVQYLDKMSREGWRIRLGQETKVVLWLEQAMPTLYILSKVTTASQSAIIERLRDPSQYLRLEGDFSDVFSVYVARGYELFALDVLNPLVMQRLKQSCPSIDIEMNGNTLQITSPTFRIAPKDRAAFEKSIRTCLEILTPYIKKQRRLNESKKHLQHEYQYFEATVRPMKLLTDSLLKIFAVCFGIVVCLILVTQLLPLFPDEVKQVGGFSITYLNPWKDTLEALSYCIIALAAITFSLAEVEIAIRRLVAGLQRRRAKATI